MSNPTVAEKSHMSGAISDCYVCLPEGRTILGPAGGCGCCAFLEPARTLAAPAYNLLSARECSFARMRPNPACECLSSVLYLWFWSPGSQAGITGAERESLAASAVSPPSLAEPQESQKHTHTHTSSKCLLRKREVSACFLSGDLIYSRCSTNTCGKNGCLTHSLSQATESRSSGIKSQDLLCPWVCLWLGRRRVWSCTCFRFFSENQVKKGLRHGVHPVSLQGGGVLCDGAGGSSTRPPPVGTGLGVYSSGRERHGIWPRKDKQGFNRQRGGRPPEGSAGTARGLFPVPRARAAWETLSCSACLQWMLWEGDRDLEWVFFF